MTIKEIRAWYQSETGDVPAGNDYRMWLEVLVSDMFKHEEQRKRDEEAEKFINEMRG